MGVTIFVLWIFLGKTLTIVAAIPTVLLFLLLAFYRPNGFPMSAFIGQAALFLFRPKMAVWERPILPMVVAKQVTAQESVMTKQNKRHPSQEKFRELARIIDSQGSGEEMRDEGEVIRDNQIWPWNF